jgi:hypothetical protein
MKYRALQELTGYGKSMAFDIQPLKGRLISRAYGIAKAMP